MESKKYILTEETIKLNNHTLYRIQAIKDFGEVHDGDLGGWIESEKNLSQTGKCWVWDDAMVYDSAKVYGNAIIYESARVWDHAKISGNSRVHGCAEIYGKAMVRGNVDIYNGAKVYDDAKILDNAKVYGNAEVFGESEIYDYAEVFGYAKVSDSWISDSACIYDHAVISDGAVIFENAVVRDNAIVSGDVRVNYFADICGDAVIKSDEDYVVYKNTWSSGRYFTYTRSNNKWRVGCFYGTSEELIAKAYKDSEKSGKCYEAIVKAQLLISSIK